MLIDIYAQLEQFKHPSLHHHASGVSVVSWEMCVDYHLAYRWLKRNTIPKKQRQAFKEMCEKYGVHYDENHTNPRLS